MSARNLFAEMGVEMDDNITRYCATVQVRNLLVGGVPANEATIRNWLRARLDAEDAHLEDLVQKTLKERFADETPGPDELITALMQDPDGPTVNGFKRDNEGFLALEGRCVKAGFKEWANSAYPGTDWDGKKGAKGVSPRKGLMSTLAERVFVEEVYVSAGVTLPTRVEERIKHVQTPQGPKSAINRVEVIESPLLTFTVRVHDDFIVPKAWARIWERGEDIGLGADRGRSDGQFDLVEWRKLARDEQVPQNGHDSLPAPQLAAV